MNTEYLTSADWSEWVSEHPSAASAMLHQCLVREQQCLSRELELYLCGDGGINAHADMRRVTWLRKRLADLSAVGFSGTAD
jgi:DNA-binding transcriptional regulator LsrR (DeoR family)